MSFNQFNGRMPFFGGRPSFSGMDLSDMAEDVPFEEVKSEHTKSQLQIDEVTRGLQISDEVMSRFGSLMDQHPTSVFLISVLFSMGAEWSDKHSVSEFGSVEAWKTARRKAADDIINEIVHVKNADACTLMMFHAMFSDGTQWAIENPAPTL